MPKIDMLVGKLLASQYRRKVVIALSENQATPAQLEKSTGIKFSHISDVLKDLLKLKLAVCVTPKLRKGKIYAITDLGKQAVKEIQKYSGNA